LVNVPSALLLDEPLSALDRALRQTMQGELKRIQRELGVAFVFVTHDQEEALAMSDRIAVMDRGRLLQVGTPTEIYARPANRTVMEFIGSVNVLDGRYAGVEHGRERVDLDGAGPVHASGAGALARGASAALLVRPERVRMSATAPAAPALALVGTIAKIAHLGFVTHCTVRLASECEVLVFRLNNVDGGGSETFTEQQRVWVWWDDTDARIFPADARIQSPSGAMPVAPLEPPGRPT
ncbi:MAG: ABC transporter ATP-binding protein, partial [Caldimonas sp.]